MTTRLPPDAIDSRVVLQTYSRVLVSVGVFFYLWTNLLPARFIDTLQLAGVPEYGRHSVPHVVMAAVAFAGCCAAGMARVDGTADRRRALLWFTGAHFLFGVMFWIQWFGIYDNIMPPIVGWAPLLVGSILLYTVVAGRPRWRRRMLIHGTEDRRHGMRVDTKPEEMELLRTRYQTQIEEAARQEERTRLARDLHDAVKQQLFVIQTAAATVDARFEHDRGGAKDALEQVRGAARDAMAEMEAMIEQLQAAPLGNAGLVDGLKRQCEALRLRTGADVSLTIGALPPNDALPPGTQQALFRAAQEALANVGRHARASHVTVSLSSDKRQLELAIADDGMGFDPHTAKKGMGIENMTTRAFEAGGSFMLSSEPGRGTTVRLTVPLASGSLRQYAIKLTLCVAGLAGISWFLAGRSLMQNPVQLAFAMVMLIGIARYVVACWRVLRQHRAYA